MNINTYGAWLLAVVRRLHGRKPAHCPFWAAMLASDGGVVEHISGAHALIQGKQCVYRSEPIEQKTGSCGAADTKSRRQTGVCNTYPPPACA